VGFEPDLEVLHQRLGLILPRGFALCSGLPPDRRLDLVELRNALETFTGNG